MAVAADLDLFASATLPDPYPALRQARHRGPVHRVAGTGFHLVLSWDLVQEAVARPDDFSSA